MKIQDVRLHVGCMDIQDVGCMDILDVGCMDVQDVGCMDVQDFYGADFFLNPKRLTSSLTGCHHVQSTTSGS